MDWYPLKLTAHVRKYAFGERLIPERLGKTDVPGGIIAETWEISDYRDTAGEVTNGPLAGTSIHQLVTEHPEELVYNRMRYYNAAAVKYWKTDARAVVLSVIAIISGFQYANQYLVYQSVRPPRAQCSSPQAPA